MTHKAPTDHLDINDQPNIDDQQGKEAETHPVVIAIAGLDPSGGAGIQADIQTLSSLQCHCIPIVATLTVQDSTRLHQSQAVNDDFLQQQLAAIAHELPIAAVKIGALGDTKNVVAVAKFIQALKNITPSLPVILDPVVKASGGGALSDSELRRALLSQLIPLCTLTTPNTPELNLLISDGNNVTDTPSLAMLGSAVLVTGGHDAPKKAGIIRNQLFTRVDNHSKHLHLDVNAIEGEYRGTGCTLSSAIAGFMASGLPLEAAIKSAQAFVSQSLSNAYSLSSGTLIPKRVSTYNK